MTIEEIKNLEGSIEQIAKLAKLVEEGKLSQSVYWEIRGEWSRKASQYKQALKGNLVEDAKQSLGDRIIDDVGE